MIRSRLYGYTVSILLMTGIYTSISQAQSNLTASIEGSNYIANSTTVVINENYQGMGIDGSWHEYSRGNGANRSSLTVQRQTDSQPRDFSYKSTQNYSSSSGGIGSQGAYSKAYTSKTTETRSPSASPPDGWFIDDPFSTINSELYVYKHYSKLDVEPDPPGGDEPVTDITYTFNTPLQTEASANAPGFFACKYYYVTPEDQREVDESPIRKSYNYTSIDANSSQTPKLVFKRLSDDPYPPGMTPRLCWTMRTVVVSYDTHSNGGPTTESGPTTRRCRYPSNSSGSADLVDGIGVASKRLARNTCRYWYFSNLSYDYAPTFPNMYYDMDYVTPVAAAASLNTTGKRAIAINSTTTPVKAATPVPSVTPYSN
jgi:hypothetical protein